MPELTFLMNADNGFSIGRRHSVCQDYARASLDPSGLPLVVLSDGCSTSPDTDVGARLLTIEVINYLRFCKRDTNTSLDMYNLCAHLPSLVRNLGLADNSLDATLIWAGVSDDGRYVIVEAFGDGIIAQKLRSGVTAFCSIEFEFSGARQDEVQGAPAYPNYLFDTDRLKTYLSQTRNGVRVHKHYARNGEVVAYETKAGMGPSRFLFEVEETEYVFLMTDGAKSFQQQVVSQTSSIVETVPIERVVAELVTAQGPGKFVERRLRAFERECHKKNIFHYDDLAVAGIWCGSGTESK